MVHFFVTLSAAIRYFQKLNSQSLLLSNFVCLNLSKRSFFFLQIIINISFFSFHLSFSISLSFFSSVLLSFRFLFNFKAVFSLRVNLAKFPSQKQSFLFFSFFLSVLYKFTLKKEKIICINVMKLCQKTAQCI